MRWHFERSALVFGYAHAYMYIELVMAGKRELSLQ